MEAVEAEEDPGAADSPGSTGIKARPGGSAEFTVIWISGVNNAYGEGSFEDSYPFYERCILPSPFGRLARPNRDPASVRPSIRFSLLTFCEPYLGHNLPLPGSWQESQ